MGQLMGYDGMSDMINGGGAGQSGAKFEDGGYLSILANMLATPLGSEQRPDIMPATTVSTRARQPASSAAWQPPQPAQHGYDEMPMDLMAGYRPGGVTGGVLDEDRAMALDEHKRRVAEFEAMMQQQRGGY